MTSDLVTDPLVSVVTPSYNQGQLIEDLVLSIKSQSYANIEHIIVDGCSTDGTLAVLRKHEATYDMRWTSEPDKGQADAVNKGFGLARGEIIGWVNADDLLFSDHTVSQVVHAFSREKADIVYGHALKINANGKAMRVKIVPRLDLELLKRWCFLVQPSIFMRSAVVRDNSLQTDLHYSMDYEYWLRLAVRYTWYHANEIVAIDRNHAERKIILQKEKSLEETAQLQREMGVRIDVWRRLMDKSHRGWLRIRGLPRMLNLHAERNNHSNLIFDNPVVLVKRQLFGKEGTLL